MNSLKSETEAIFNLPPPKVEEPKKEDAKMEDASEGAKPAEGDAEAPKEDVPMTAEEPKPEAAAP